MSDGAGSADHAEFATWVHDALSRLYDSPYLQTHSLAAALAEPQDATPVERGRTLRRMLLDAIQAMRPEGTVPAQSPDWRAYRILELRYIEGLPPQEVMSQLALGKSQYFRDQARVLEALTDLLWQRSQSARPAGAPQSAGPPREDLIHSETDRLIARATWERVSLTDLLDDLRPIVEPLARARTVTLLLAPRDPPLTLNADRVMLRQAVLNVITYALDMAQGGRVEVTGWTTDAETGLHVDSAPPDANSGTPPPAPQRLGRGLDISRQLLAALGGELRLDAAGTGHWTAHLVWPVSAARLLLVVDDNQGLADLFRRYTAGSPWQVLGAASGDEARRLVAERPPTLIALDVMMPGEDGWEFLVTLKQSAAARHIPVIICSVLNEPQLALQLGAVAYLQKPVTRPVLLQALAAWEPPGTTPAPAR